MKQQRQINSPPTINQEREDRVPEQIGVVVCDVGEIVVNETREYGTWAQWLTQTTGRLVTTHEFSAVMGAMIQRHPEDPRAYLRTFQVFQPGFVLDDQRRERLERGHAETFGEQDLYPDFRGCARELREAGLQVGLAGNQTVRAGEILRGLNLPVDWIRTSDDWGAEKPAQEFFDRVIDEAGVPAERILYVGDRLDNDVKPAQRAGMQTVLVRRGPWGRILEDPETEARCLAVVHDLTGLPTLVTQHNSAAVPL